MHVASISEVAGPPVHRLALFEAGFRVFFLLAPLYATSAILEWLLIYSGAIVLPIDVAPTLWHAHEMIFGFAAAGVAGFFLTAVPNWTGAPFVRGLPLVILAAVWLAGRVAMHLGSILPLPLTAAIDLAFLPMLGAMVAPPLLRHGVGKNAMLLIVLSALWLADAAMQVEFAGASLGLSLKTGARGARIAIDIIALLITVIGGRIVPAFTTAQLKLRSVRRLPRSFAWLDRMVILSMALLLASEIIDGGGEIAALVALAAALLQAVRLALWRGLATRGTPILWVLHLGYAWLVLGLALKGGEAFLDWLPESAALHALTIGAIGTMMTGVMSRAALGHTGRKLEAHALIVVTYGLISFAALLRILAPLVPEQQVHFFICSGIAWSLAFALFLWVYTPILIHPRTDGQSG
jgi:uncharacterized protein involved in response to NO